jgi:hypothetical protein
MDYWIIAHHHQTIKSSNNPIIPAPHPTNSHDISLPHDLDRPVHLSHTKLGMGKAFGRLGLLVCGFSLLELRG